MKSKVEAARDSEKKTKKQLDDVDNERKRLEKALASARDELDSTYVHWREFREIWEGGETKVQRVCVYIGGSGRGVVAPSPDFVRQRIQDAASNKLNGINNLRQCYGMKVFVMATN